MQKWVVIWLCLSIALRSANENSCGYEPADAQAIVGKAASKERIILGRIRQEVVVRPEMWGDVLLRELTGGIPPFGELLKPALSTAAGRSATYARTGLEIPLRSFAPRSSNSNRLPSSFRVLSAMTTAFGLATP
jgi:hypothetical protein